MKPHIVKYDGQWRVISKGRTVEAGSTVSLAWERYFVVTYRKAWDIYKVERGIV